MKQDEVSFELKARYYTLGTFGPETRHVWFVLHGYGQLAQFFLPKFKILERDDTVIVAPEGLSRFYLNNFAPGSGRANDRVGATWMTKENRLMDIDNYVAYLDAVFAKVVQRSDVRVTILGFSQGSATACRWCLSDRIFMHRLVLWAGMFPPDMNFEMAKDRLRDKEVVVVYGKKDPFLSDDLFKQMQAVSERMARQIRQITFDGEHEIDASTLAQLGH